MRVWQHLSSPRQARLARDLGVSLKSLHKSIRQADVDAGVTA
jgi:hypothetical protein